MEEREISIKLYFLYLQIVWSIFFSNKKRLIFIRRLNKMKVMSVCFQIYLFLSQSALQKIHL